MADLIQTLSLDSGALAILIAGLALDAACAIWAWLRDGRVRAQVATADELLLAGRVDEARVFAHQQGGFLRALADRLSRGERPAEIPSALGDWAWGIGLQLPWLLLVVYGASSVRDPSASHRVQTLAASMAGLGLALPIGLGATLLLFQLGRSTRLRVRALAAQVLQTMAGAQVEAEQAEDRGALPAADVRSL